MTAATPISGIAIDTRLDADGHTSAGLAFADGRIERLAPPDGNRRREALRFDRAVAVPGLVDAHLHALLGGLRLEQLDLSGVRSRAAFEEAVATRHATLDGDAWLEGWGWSEENWLPRSSPDRGWLAACGDRPAVCWRMDHHACVVNDAVLERLSLAADPPGGQIVRGADGHPTGLLLEAAAWTLAKPLMPAPSVARRRTALRSALAFLNRHGITTAGSMEYGQDLVEAIKPLRSELTVRLRVTVLDRDWPMDFSLHRRFDDDDRLAVIGCKAFIDGTLGSRTARMLEDYADDPGNRGMLVELAERGVLDAWIRAVATEGLSPSMHAIGDEAVRLALDAADLVEASVRPRIEHAQTIHRDDVPRFRGRIASMQPLHKADDGRFAERRLGADRMERFFPFRRLLDHGAVLAFGSDWPIVSPDPIAGMRAAITGLDADGRTVGADQRIAPTEALRAYTAGAAAALGEPDLGRLHVGGHADVTVLSSDPLAADWIDDPPRVLATIVGGELVYADAEVVATQTAHASERT